MNRPGFMYSMFALAVLGLLAFIVAAPIQVEELPDQTAVSRVDETAYFLTSVEEDVPRATRIVTKRAVIGAINTVAADDQPLPDAADAVRSGFLNGTINGTEQPLLRDAAIDDWIARMEQQARRTGYDLDIMVDPVTTAPAAPAAVWLNATFTITLDDDASDTRFSRTVDHERRVELTNVTDPLLLLETSGRYSHGFRSCPVPDPATRHATGTESHYGGSENWTAGTAAVRPANGPVTNISDRADTVLVVDDICAYSDATIQDDLSDFAGVASETAGGISGDGSTVCGDANSAGIDAYVGGADGATAIDPDSRAVLTEEQVWQNTMYTAVETGCYLSDADGPNVYDRIEGRLSGTGGPGWASLLVIPDLPSDFQEPDRSAVDHVYFDDGGGTTSRIKGVTGEHAWFRLDQDHVDAWDVGPLAYD